MPTSEYFRIRKRILIVVGIMIALLLILFAGHSFHEYRLEMDSAAKRSASYASALKEHGERAFSEADNCINNLINEIMDEGGIPFTRSERFFRMLNSSAKSGPQFSSVYFVDKNGIITAHSQEFRFKPIDVSDRDYFRHHRDTPTSGLFISKPFISKLTGTSRFGLSRAVRESNGDFAGLISVTFETGYFEQFYRSIDVGHKGRMLLATTAGTLLVNEPSYDKPLPADFSSSPLFSDYLPKAPHDTRLAYSPVTKDLRIMSYRVMDRFPVVAVVSLARNEVMAPWLSSIIVNASIALLLMVAVVMLAASSLRYFRKLEQSNASLVTQQEDLAEANSALLREVDERRELEAKLSVIARQWQDTFDSVGDAVWLLDMEKRIVQANHATQRIFGIPPEEVIGLRCCDVAHDNAVTHENCPFERMKESGRRSTMQLSMRTRWYEVTLDPVFNESGEPVSVVHVVKDISDLKYSEQREYTRSEILERIARGEPLSDLLDFITRSIEKERPGALCSILLVSPDQKRLLNGAAPSLPDFYNMAAHRTRIGEGIGSCGTAAFRRERVVVEDISTHPFWKGFTAAEEAGLRSCWSEPIFSSNGKLLGTFAIYHREPAAPGLDEIRLIEQASAFAGIAIERSRSEEERSGLVEQLHQSQKMEAIGHLAGGMAHDFNNLLTPIIVYAEMLRRSASAEDEKGRNKIEAIIKASNRARELTQQLLSFGRKQPMDMAAVDLNDVVASFHSIIRRTLRENIGIELRLSKNPLCIRADRSKIEQIILNLAINAQDAIRDVGAITIEIDQVMVDDEYAARHPGLEAAGYAMLRFSDSGCGMSEETMKRIFEPFFTTKQVGQGTGLGLANVYGIVKQHGGQIEVNSTPGQGTVFKLYFLLTDEPLGINELHDPAHEEFHAGSGTVLLVEDNDMVREMAKELLGFMGYEVHVAGHPEQALQIARELNSPIDLLLTDIVMPGMNGVELYEELRSGQYLIEKVLYMSGYTENISVNELEEAGIFLQKPFTVNGFTAKVREVLGR